MGKAHGAWILRGEDESSLTARTSPIVPARGGEDAAAAEVTINPRPKSLNRQVANPPLRTAQIAR